MNKILDYKLVYRNTNFLWLLFIASKDEIDSPLSKRDQYYDVRAGYIYKWHMHVINFFRNRGDSWSLEKEKRA